MAAIENEKIYGLKIRESANDGSDFSTPEADYRVLFLGEDGSFHLKDSAAAITDFAPSGVVPWALLPYYGATSVDTAITVGASNRALYFPCILPAGATITGVKLNIGTSSGNICVGLYDGSLNRVATSGAVASPGTTLQTVNFTASYAAAAGRYYLALSADNTTVTFYGVNPTNTSVATVKFQETAHPLPATASPSATPSGRQISIAGLISGGYP